MKKSIYLITIIGVLALAAYLRSFFFGGSAADAEIVPESAKVERGNIRLEVSSVGIVQSNLDVEIKCKASGEIISLPYDVSDPVKEGDLLVELDPVDEERNVRQAEVRLKASEAQLAQAQSTLETSILDVKNARAEAVAALKSAEAQAADRRGKANRFKELLEKKYASTEECETAETEAIAAAAALESAEVRLQGIEVQEKALEIRRQDVILSETTVESDRIALDTAKQRLVYTKVYAPITGVISGRLVQEGQIISSPTNNVSGGTALLMLSDLSRVFIWASVDESDIGKIAVGQPASITVDAFSETRFRGEVVRIATKGVSVSNVVTFEVKIEVLDEAKSKLRPEMTANVDILVADKADALLLPSEFVQGRGGNKYVLKPATGEEEQEKVPVTVGIDDGMQVEILAGLDEGTEVQTPKGGLSSSWDQGEAPEGMTRDQARTRYMMMRSVGGGRGGR